MVEREVLEDLGVGEEAFLGAGAEARVYALEDGRVVRIVDPRTTASYLDRLTTFYRKVDRVDVPFHLPRVLESRVHPSGRRYTIEARIPGMDMFRVMERLTGPVRDDAIASFIHSALAIRRATGFGRRPHLPIADPDTSHVSFGSMLVSRALRSGERRPTALCELLPQWDAVCTAWAPVMRAQSARETALVHGDYFPGNVMATRDGEVTGVIDFSNLTMIGDPRLDLVSALCFLPQLDSWTPRDSKVARAAIPDQERLEDVFELYRQFYALYFTPFAYEDDPALFAWCRETLHGCSL